MKVHVMTPYSRERTFAVACNEAVAMIGEDDWICIIDHDFMFLAPESIADLYKYAEMCPDSLLTCYTNRVGSRIQCLNGVISENDSMKAWINRAIRMRQVEPSVTEIKGVISGYLLFFSKKLWNDVSHFPEDKTILGVDNGFSGRVLNKGKKIYLMNNMLGWHSYRIHKDRHDKTHLV